MWTREPQEGSLSRVCAALCLLSSVPSHVKDFNVLSLEPCLSVPLCLYDITVTSSMWLQAGGGEVWSEAAVARFSELVAGVPVKAGVVSSQGTFLTLQLYVR